MKKIVVTGACGLVISALIVVFGLSSERDPGKISQAQPLMQDERNDTNSPFFETQIYRLAGDKMNVPLTDVDEGLVSFEERLRVITQRRPRKNYNRDDILAAMEREEVWAPQAAHAELPLSEEELVDGRHFFKLDVLKLESLMPGDTLKVGIEEVGAEYEVIIDRVVKHTHNSISWYGHIDIDGETYDASFTRGESLTVGGLQTPQGQYSLQAHGESGWIASAGMLFKSEDEVDYLIPEH